MSGDVGGRQDVSGDELRALAERAGQESVDVASLRDRVQDIVSGLDRRGWNAGAFDGQWSVTRFGLTQLSGGFADHHAELLQRAGEADTLNTPSVTPVPTLTPVAETQVSQTGPQPVPAPGPVGTPTVPEANPPEPGHPLPGGDFWASRAIDFATEAFKRVTQPQFITRMVPQLVEITEREVTAVVANNAQVVAFVVRQTTSEVLTLTAQEELLNGPAMAVKGFLAAPLKGVPLVSGAVQGVADWVTEPDLSTGQRIGRVAVAAGAATLVAVVVAATLPEDAIAAVAIGVPLLAAGAVDVFAKPVLFDAFGLNPPRKDQRESGQSETVLP